MKKVGRKAGRQRKKKGSPRRKERKKRKEGNKVGKDRRTERRTDGWREGGKDRMNEGRRGCFETTCTLAGEACATASCVSGTFVIVGRGMFAGR